MKVTPTPGNCIALAALSFVMQETHELAHTSVGRLLCGCWGRRNFNVWGLCRDCASGEPLTLLATVAGPLYSFGVIWTGYFLLKRTSARQASVGFALIVSSMPFSRVLTPLFGSGDEVFSLIRLGVDRAVAWPAAVLAVFLLAVPPMLAIYRKIANRRKGLWLTGLIFVPFFLVGLVVFGVLQTLLLGNGILAEYWILGSPMLVTLWLGVSLATVLAFARHLATLLQPIAAAVSVGS